MASVLVSGRLAGAVYAPCMLAEQPANPMLLETLTTEGCSELRYPLAGHLALRPAGSSERGDGGAAAHGGEEVEL